MAKRPQRFDEVAAARESRRERLAAEIAALQHAARILPPCDEAFLLFVSAEVKKDELNRYSRATPLRRGDMIDRR